MDTKPKDQIVHQEMNLPGVQNRFRLCNNGIKNSQTKIIKQIVQMLNSDWMSQIQRT